MAGLGLKRVSRVQPCDYFLKTFSKYNILTEELESVLVLVKKEKRICLPRRSIKIRNIDLFH